MTKKYEVDGYSVVFVTGTRNFALHQHGVAGRAFFQKRRDAVAYKRELAEHGMKTRVVKARAILRQIP